MTTENTTLKIYGRKGTGKNASFRIRDGGMVPAVVYGPKLKAPVPVSVVPNDFLAVYKANGKTKLISLEATDGAPAELTGTKIFIKAVQAHPYKNKLQHVDLHQLDLARKIRVVVPLNFTGKAKGLAEGGIMQIATRSVEIKGLPTDIPSVINVDVTAIEVNGSIHVEELSKMYDGSKFEFIFDNDYALMSIVPPEDEKAATPVAGAPDAAAAAAPGAPAAAGAKAAPGAPAAKAAPGAPAAKAAPAKK
jgi:large subunit ribosomal protein L25